MTFYEHSTTGELWTREELEKAYHNFRHESDYLQQFDSFDEYLDDQIQNGKLIKLEEEI